MGWSGRGGRSASRDPPSVEVSRATPASAIPEVSNPLPGDPDGPSARKTPIAAAAAASPTNAITRARTAMLLLGSEQRDCTHPGGSGPVAPRPERVSPVGGIMFLENLVPAPRRQARETPRPRGLR